MKFRKNISLKNYTTFKIGGRAKYFFVAKTKVKLIKAIQEAKKRRLPFFILGGGSNILISDKGFNGLVIKTGKPLSLYVSRGLEWAVGIPGTIEGAVYENAGAFGKSMKDVVKSVEVFDTKTGKFKIFKNKDCQFVYRGSIFKKNPNLVILSVKLKYRAPSYSEARRLKRGEASLNKKIKKYLKHRKETQPLNYPSAGSVFKNPKNHFVGQLIEECGLKGKRIGRAEISKKHANFLINLGGAKSEDVLKLIKLIKRKIKQVFGIKLKEEIQFLER